MTEETKLQDERIALYIEAIEKLKRGDCDLDIPTLPRDNIGILGEALTDLAGALNDHYCELEKLDELTVRINAGLLLDDILENVYRDFHEFIPYNRIGFSLIDDDGKTVRAYWAKTDQPVVELGKGYAAPLEGSSLETIMRTGKPRILNDLRAYLKRKPDSESTRLVVAEGMCSSLTCPLIANGAAVGFMFFSSICPNTYAHLHVDIFKRISGQLSTIVEKGRLISELAEKNAAVECQNRELQRLNELKNRFLGMAAHDLRNPIWSIQMIAEFMMEAYEDLDKSECEKLTVDIVQQTSQMSVLLNDLLDVNQIESGRFELTLAQIDANDFLNAVVRQHNMMANSKGTRVVLENTPAGEIRADSHHLRQVMDNLISNAVKFSPPGSTVRVSAARNDSAWRVCVQDEGPGISAQDRARLFQDFARLSAKPTGGERSTGLGLAISRRVVEAHGGQIGVDSTEGRGAVFWFTLPE